MWHNYSSKGLSIKIYNNMKFHKKIKPCLILLVLIIAASCSSQTGRFKNIEGDKYLVGTPINVKINLSEEEKRAAKRGQLLLYDRVTNKEVPVQIENLADKSSSNVVVLFTKEFNKSAELELLETGSLSDSTMKSFVDAETHQFVINEDGEKILQYNYRTVYEKDVIRPLSQKDKELEFGIMSGIYYDEYLKCHPELERNDTTRSSIYSIPRSNYIHPLYGLNGEMLTNDWPDGGHPHPAG